MLVLASTIGYNTLARGGRGGHRGGGYGDHYGGHGYRHNGWGYGSAAVATGIGVGALTGVALTDRTPDGFVYDDGGDYYNEYYE